MVQRWCRLTIHVGAKNRISCESLEAQHGGKHDLMATVYKRNSTYWVRFQWHGKEVRRSAHTTSKATARQSLAQLLDEHRRLDRGGNAGSTYREALERFTYLSADAESQDAGAIPHQLSATDGDSTCSEIPLADRR